MMSTFIRFFTWATACFVVTGLAAADRPNIIMILADDLGYSDLGCYGGEISTPNIDGLAANGARMTQVYNSARCCPTRASLMTGLYPSQAGIGDFTTGKPDPKRGPGYLGRLNNQCVTMAAMITEWETWARHVDVIWDGNVSKTKSGKGSRQVESGEVNRDEPKLSAEQVATLNPNSSESPSIENESLKILATVHPQEELPTSTTDQQGVTIVPLDVRVLNNGEVSIRALDPD